MSIWLVRAGSHGEYEQKFIQDERIYLTWDDLDKDIKKVTDRDQLFTLLDNNYPNSKPKRLQNWISQIWGFVHDMEIGDLVILPLKSQSTIYVGEITGDYSFEPNGPNPYYHWRTIKWVGEDIPRSHFGQDLLYSFGAFLTICRVKRNNAEERILAMRDNDWTPEKIQDVISSAGNSDVEETVSATDIEELAQDQIAKIIEAKFKGHNLTRLIEAILKAKGYTTYRSPEGADGGADILAGAGTLGFGEPRLCVEVKSEANPIDRPTVDKLLGAVTKFGANEGLFVSWSGFKSNVQKELAASFFRVRLWSQKDIIEHLLEAYDKLDDDIQAELPLKRIWTVALTGDE